MLHSCGHTHFHRHYRDQDAPGGGGADRQAGLAPAKSAPLPPSHDEIAALAYSYWEARGRQGDSQWEDWFRAEREFRRKA
jgi:hypothetical protein